MRNKKTRFLRTGLVLLLFLLCTVTFIAANNINRSEIADEPEGNITVDFKDADIGNVLRILSLKGGVNIVSDPDIKGMITIRLTNVHWEKALDIICRTYAFAYERDSNIIRVTTQEKLGQENLVTEVIPLSFSKASDVVTAISEMTSERGKIKYDERSNLVIVTDIPTNVYKIKQIIERLDTVTPQVMIETKIIETSLSSTEQFGINWQARLNINGSSISHTLPFQKNKSYGDLGEKYIPLPAAADAADFHGGANTPSFPFAAASDFTFGTLSATDFSLVLEALLSRGKTQILSNPRITTLDNQPAKIHVGTEWPIGQYTYNEDVDRFVITGWEYKQYGILLEVTPTVNKDGYVTLSFKPEVSERTSDITFEGALVPVLSTQTVEAKVMVKDGETLVVGGLIKDKTVTTKTKVPFLGDIPLLGLLFTHKAETLERKDLLIFITPHLIIPGRITARLQQTASRVDKKIEDQQNDPIVIDDSREDEIYIK
ncbi:MAG: type IV pilus secretin PilQ [Candidatus Omnitrophota bacterium]